MKNFKYIFTILLPLHILFLSLGFYINLSYVSLIYFLMGYMLIGGLGVEIGLHKYASHRSVDLNKISKPIVLFLSILSCQGHPIWWAAVHRGNHHRHSDTEKDSHSPINGKWNAFMGWILNHDLTKVNYKFSIDLLKDKIMVITSKYYEIIILATWITAGVISIDFLFWAILLPTLVSFYSVNMINLFCHSNFGYRNFNTEDNSRNISLLGYFCWGNGWHNNHHYKASSFDFGKSISGKKWEIDPCMIFLPFIKK